MSLSRMGYDIIRAGTDLQVAVYEYLQFDVNSAEVGTSQIERVAKEIGVLVRKLKKEDSK